MELTCAHSCWKCVYFRCIRRRAKRCLIAETLTTKPAVTCWDDSTRDLDPNTALHYAKSLRIMADVSDRTIVTLYQVEEEIYTPASTTPTALPSAQPWYCGIANWFRQFPDQKHSAACFLSLFPLHGRS